jgi:exosortase/archaeosortase
LTTFHKISIIASLTFVIISFTQTALFISGIEDLPGWKIFFLGWLSISQGLIENQWYISVIWLANPFYIIALIKLLGGRTSATIYSCISAILALAFLVIANNKNLLDKLHIDAVGPAYYWWLTGVSVLAATSIHFEIFPKPGSHKKQHGSL